MTKRKTDKPLVVLAAAGTDTLRHIVTPALKRLAAEAGGEVPEHIRTVLWSVESAGDVGLAPLLGPEVVHYKLPPQSALKDRILRLEHEYPYLSPEARTAIVEGRGVGTGSSASPGKGRAFFSLIAEKVVKRFRAIQREAAVDRRDVIFVLLVQAHSGTSRGSLVDAAALAGRYLDCRYRRAFVVLPMKDVHAHNYAVHARNALSALSVLEHGMVEASRHVHDPAQVGLDIEPRPERLFDDSMVFWSDFRTEESVGRGFATLGEYHAGVSRVLERSLARDPLYAELDDYLNNQQPLRGRHLPSPDADAGLYGFHTSAVNEGRIFLDPKLLEERVRRQLLERLGASLAGATAG